MSQTEEAVPNDPTAGLTIAVPLNLMPVPVAWDVKTTVVNDEGVQAVIVQLSTPMGFQALWFDDESARKFGQQMLDAGKKATLSVTAPRKRLIVPGR